MKILLLGPPGSGKGTQAGLLSKKYYIPHISMGGLLRDEVGRDSVTGKKIEKVMNAGRLIPNEIVGDVLKKRLSEEDCKRGFVLDGFPRNLEQAKILDFEFDVAISMELDDDIAVDRMARRRQCKGCGKIFAEGTKCDECRSELYQRDDDKPKAIKQRLKVYHDETRPIIEHYGKKRILKTVDASQSVENVFADITKQL